jgi:hypothetical protein
MERCESFCNKFSGLPFAFSGIIFAGLFWHVLHRTEFGFFCHFRYTAKVIEVIYPNVLSPLDTAMKCSLLGTIFLLYSTTRASSSSPGLEIENMA